MSSGRDEMLANTPTDEVDYRGRPTKYDPKYCLEVVKLGKLGKSFEQMSAQLDISYRTLCRWRDEHEDFCHALEDAQTFAQSWWEEQASSHMVEIKEGPRLNASLWSRSMAARFPKKYRQEVKQEITGADGAPLLTAIQVSFVEPDHSQPE